MKIIRFLFVAIATLLCSVSVNAENIEFADAKVKELCVANWDTNGDGELSKAEAAIVTTLDSVFTGNTDIVSFREFQYFTGITEINREYGITVVMISHDIQTAIKYASHILHLGNKQLFFGEVDEYLQSHIGREYVGGVQIV